MSRVANGMVLSDRYALVRPIAAGGMGEVWQAHDEVLHRDVAVKLLRDEFVDDPDVLARFRAEALHVAAVTHPGIATMFDYGTHDVDGRTMPYFVMELVAGEPLSTVMARGPLSVPAVASILAGCAEALAAAHASGIVHRDVKPSNILLLADGSVKLTDFGIALTANSVPLTRTGNIVGTAHYMSPEQAAGRMAVPASDIYSLGLVGYELLCGRRPFAADQPAALALAHLQQPPPPLPSRVPAALSALIMGMLAKDPAARPRDARALATDLRHSIPDLVATDSPDQVHRVERGNQIAEAEGRAIAPRTAVMPLARVERSRHRRAAAWIAVLAVVAVGLWAVATRDRASLPAGAGSATTTVPVRPEDFIGKPATDAVAALTQAGLHVTQQAVSGTGQPAGIVVGVDRTGVLPAGTAVVLRVSDGSPTTTATTAAPKPPAAPHHKGKGKGGG